MHLIEKGKKDASPVHMDWDQAQAALRTGKYDLVDEGGNPDEDRSDPIVPDLTAPPKDPPKDPPKAA